MPADKEDCKLDLTGKSMYFALSWKKFDFVVTPSEFRGIFSREDFVFLADRVREKTQSKIISKEQVFSDYERYFERIILREDGRTNELWDDEVRLYLIDGEDKLCSDYSLEGKAEGEFKILDSAKPCAKLAPFNLLYNDEKKRLSTAYFEPDGVFGLRLAYPKTLSLRDENGELGGSYETDDYEMSRIYTQLVANIKKLAKKAKVANDNGGVKADFWISKAAACLAGRNFYLKSNGLKFV